MELLEVECEYTGFDELWDAIVDGAGPAGAWVVARRRAAREARAELHRQVGEPERRVHAARPRVGDARYARERTLVALGAGADELTSTSSSRSTNSTYARAASGRSSTDVQPSSGSSQPGSVS